MRKARIKDNKNGKIKYQAKLNTRSRAKRNQPPDQEPKRNRQNSSPSLGAFGHPQDGRKARAFICSQSWPPSAGGCPSASRGASSSKPRSAPNGILKVSRLPES
jgi:hypothetical protein